MDQKINDFLAYINASPTPWHLCNTSADRLKSKGWIELLETEPWVLKPGSSYFLKKNGSALLGFRTPKSTPLKTCVFAAHTDSPALKLKPKPERIIDNMVAWGLSIYGGPLLQSWWNKELVPAGMISFLDKNKKMQNVLIKLDTCPLILAQLSIHLHEKPTHKGLAFHKENEAIALLGHPFNKKIDESHFEAILKKELPIHTLISHDLFLVPKEGAGLWGFNQEGVAAYRLDNLASCHAILLPFLEKSTYSKDTLEVFYFSDHEEVGSSTAQGADSPFLLESLYRISDALKMPRESFYPFKAKSSCFSFDVAHAKHPGQPARTESYHNTLFGGGIALKTSALQRYAQDPELSAWLRHLCLKSKVPVQDFIMRNDVPSGSTIGPILASGTGIRTLDLGHPLLSMHASRELISCKDHLTIIKLITKILQNPPK